MKPRVSSLRRLLEMWDGDAVAPVKLEHVITELEAPSADTAVARLRTAIHADLGDVPHALAVLPNLPAAEMLHLARRLGWTVKALTDWDPRQDKSGMRIEGALASAAAWNADGMFWHLGPVSYQSLDLSGGHSA